MQKFILAIDQGTTSTRAIVFDVQGHIIRVAQAEIQQYFPELGWVEHDAEEIWQKTLQVCKEALQKANLNASQIAAIGITNQRETCLLWDKNTGKPLSRAIVWQDRRTAIFCERLKQQVDEKIIQQKTGLLLDPYFSASKWHWLLQHIPHAKDRAEKGEILAGTIDSFLLWHLTAGKQHSTDVSNASRTLLCDIRHFTWDAELLKLFDIPAQILPTIKDNIADFGETTLFGAAIPICAMIGDQQSALVGQACFEPNMMKSTYGTGCFLVMNTGEEILYSQHKLLSTVAYKIKHHCHYALEGSIFIAGAAVQWLRDALRMIQNAADTQKIVESVSDNAGVYLVPAFTGLGAPYWDPNARGAIFGLTRDTGIAHIVRAALEAVCYQTRDLVTAMKSDGAKLPSQLRVDGGMSKNDFVMQFLSDILQVSVERPLITETTALGASMLAALGAGYYESLTSIAKAWQSERLFKPSLSANTTDRYYQGWLHAVQRCRG